MAIKEGIFRTRAEVVKALHSGVLTLIGASVATLQLTQQSPFKKHYGTMVTFLIAICVYVVAGLASIEFKGLVEEVTTSVSLLSGLLASLLLFLIMVPALGWVCVALWVLLVFGTAYRIKSCWHPYVRAQQDNQSPDRVTIEMPPVDGQKRGHMNKEDENIDDDQRSQKKISVGTPATQWISVYSNCSHQGMAQRYHHNVESLSLSPKILKGKEDGLFIRCVASCSNLWALIMDESTGFSDQVYVLSPFFLPYEWIEEQWDKDFYITTVAGANDGSSLVVMSKGTQFCKKQKYRVDDSFPLNWIKKRWRQKYYITAMATAGSRWAIVMSQGAGFSRQVVELKMSQGAGFSRQVVELNFQYPSERVRKRRYSGYNITAIAATADRAAFVLSMPITKPANGIKEVTVGSSDFPSRHIKEKWEKDFYVTSLCYGLNVS